MWFKNAQLHVHETASKVPRIVLVLLLLVVAIITILETPTISQEKSTQNETFITHDEHRIVGHIVGFNAGVLEMSRKFGKHYTNRLEYDKLSDEQKYLVTAILKAHGFSSLEAGIKVWGAKPYRFVYPIVNIQCDDGRVLGIPLYVLSKKNIDTILPEYNMWYQQQIKIIAAAKAVEESNKLTTSTTDQQISSILQDADRERKERDENRFSPYDGSYMERTYSGDTTYGDMYKDSSGRTFMLPKKKH